MTVFIKWYWQSQNLKSWQKKRRSDIYIEESNTFVKPIAFNAKKSDGFIRSWWYVMKWQHGAGTQD